MAIQNEILNLKSSLCALVWCAAALAQGPGPVIDGRLNDPIWQKAPAQRLAPAEPFVPAESGGEVRTVIHGRYLLIGAVLPERGGRITARMVGRHPPWEDEDM